MAAMESLSGPAAPFSAPGLIFWKGREKETVDFLDDGFADGKTKASTAVAACCAAVCLTEWLEELLLLFFCNTNTGICHAAGHLDSVFSLVLDKCSNGDCPLCFCKPLSRDNCTEYTAILSASSLLKSKISLMTESNVSAQTRMLSDIPMTPFNGVRNSWETFAKNVLFAFAASSLSLTISIALASATLALRSASRACSRACFCTSSMEELLAETFWTFLKSNALAIEIEIWLTSRRRTQSIVTMHVCESLNVIPNLVIIDNKTTQSGSGAVNNDHLRGFQNAGEVDHIKTNSRESTLQVMLCFVLMRNGGCAWAKPLMCSVIRCLRSFVLYHGERNVISFDVAEIRRYAEIESRIIARAGRVAPLRTMKSP
ncbi:hypothetical protein KCU81_g19, partial [Aureobasidium melanogenum]